MAAALQARGIGPGDHVALLGIDLTGPGHGRSKRRGWPPPRWSCCPLPMRLGSVDGSVVAQTRARVRNADIALLVVDADLAAFIEPAAGDPPMAMLDQLVGDAGRAGPGSYEQPRIDPASLAILQFTSGSTADPRA